MIVAPLKRSLPFWSFGGLVLAPCGCEREGASKVHPLVRWLCYPVKRRSGGERRRGVRNRQRTSSAARNTTRSVIGGNHWGNKRAPHQASAATTVRGKGPGGR